MKLPWGSIVLLGFIVMTAASVAMFEIPTLEELGQRRSPKEPLSKGEIERLGALQAVHAYCNDYVEETPKAAALYGRLRSNPAQRDALFEAKESFKNADCKRLRFQFPDTYRWVNL